MSSKHFSFPSVWYPLSSAFESVSPNLSCLMGSLDLSLSKPLSFRQICSPLSQLQSYLMSAHVEFKQHAHLSSTESAPP